MSIPNFVSGKPSFGFDKYLEKNKNPNLDWMPNTFSSNEMSSPKFFFLSKRAQETLINVSELRGMTDSEVKIDLPFKTVILEAKSPFLNAPSDGRNIVCYSIFCHEVSPNNFRLGCSVYAEKSDKFPEMIGVANLPGYEEKAVYAKRVLAAVFNVKNGATFVDEKVRQRFKIGRKGGREFLKISRITHIVIGRNQRSVSPIMGGEIDWKHCWGVRGHWRVSSGLGKDRDGNYTVSGFTWVKPHIKGDKSAPYIEKTKVLKIASDNSRSGHE